MKIILAIFLFLLVLFSFFPKVSDEEILQAREAVKNGALIVDVRTPKEFQMEHVDGAINLPIEEIMQNRVNLPKNKELILYCRTGSRRSASAQVLQRKGWTVYNVATQEDWEREIKLEK
ncbi:MAG: rhodanese-like domain-containing protein [Helicobacteraceae bacterium]|nr:rhodanese-like domain-containing protein [Candidatus Sulfurimonas ponti]MBL6972766.1 rhodanese-like domain-containing protein [Sulfurimonas sp.]